MKIRTQYNYFTFPEVKKKKKTKEKEPKFYNELLTVQGLDTSIFSMLENGLTDEGETKKGTYTENMLVNAFSDPLEFETEFEKAYNRQFFDNLKENRDNEILATAEQSDSQQQEAPQNNEATEQNKA